MSDGPDRRNPLSPYYPSETPSLSTSGRRWVAIVLLLTMVIGFLFYIVEWIIYFL